MTPAEHAIRQLTQPNNWCAPGAHNPPLLDMLADAAEHPQTSTGGPTSHGIKINEPALRLKDQIEHRINQWARAYQIQITWRPPVTLANTWQHVTALHNTGNLNQDEYDTIGHKAQQWVTQIGEVLDPYKVIPVRDTCPECRQQWMLTRTGDRQTVLRAYIHPEKAGWIDCQACGWIRALVGDTTTWIDTGAA